MTARAHRSRAVPGPHRDLDGPARCVMPRPLVQKPGKCWQWFSSEISRMAAAPKRVAGRPDNLPAQRAAADPLHSYCPDLNRLSWSFSHSSATTAARCSHMASPTPSNSRSMPPVASCSAF